MEDTSVQQQPAINEAPDVSPVTLPEQSLSLAERVNRLESELELN